MLWIHFGLSILFTTFLPKDTSQGVLELLTVVVTIVAIAYGEYKTHIQLDRSLLKINFKAKDVGKSFVLLTGFSFAAMLVISLLSGLLINLIGRPLPQETFQFDFSQVSSWALLAYICILGPIFEELMFRGVILRTLARYNRTFAIIASSIVFGLMHLYLQQGTHAFIIGMVLAYISLKYESLSLTIILHIIHNTLTTIMPFFQLGLSIDFIFRVLYLIIMLVWLVKNFKQLKHEFISDPMDQPLFSRLFIRFSFATWFVLFRVQTVMSFINT